MNNSNITCERKKFKPILPNILQNRIKNIDPVSCCSTYSENPKIQQRFINTYGKPVIKFRKGLNTHNIQKKSMKVAVIFSGGQAPGGHNVIAGIFDCLKKVNPENRLIGYLGGAAGILKNQYKIIEKDQLKHYRNTGGFHLIYSGRDKIETVEQLSLMKKHFETDKVDALIIIGGDDSNTNAAIIAEYFKQKKLKTCIVGVPKTIDGDLQNQYVEIPFGFDTATKIYSELVGNVCIDVCSARKYWHFIRLMGRSASHITLEVGLQTHPNIIVIGEEVLEKRMTLSNIVDNIIDIILKRSKLNKDFGVILIPEGLIEFIPEIRELIYTINDILYKNRDIIKTMKTCVEKEHYICSKLPSHLYNLMQSFPHNIIEQLLLDRDPHGNIQVSSIETDKLLITMIHKKLNKLCKLGKYHGKFNAISHFFGYEGRCGLPSNFDANYAYALGYNAAVLIINGFTGYLSYINKLAKVPYDWECGGVPIVNMINIEKRKGEDKFVIQKTLVDLHGIPFMEYISNKEKWALNEDYISPGPIQYYGKSCITDRVTKTLQLKCKKPKKI
ncbi:MAG: diphosphate--fructose-6-phosphate 1-phosphotransferase [Endomicrobium sp.]|jgi:pyrophosphate--fructose-6-phosphate 1-phosphotransferase|nr:diphosphate--fructose-6-phosphate 1-phosphotransferase [Endomicrobium sp.]